MLNQLPEIFETSKRTAELEAHGYVQNGKCRLYYEQRGKGPDLVFCNNFFMHASHWAPYVTNLIEKYRVTTYDLRHQGRSDQVNGSIDLQDHVDDLLALLDTLDIKSCVLVSTCISTAIAKRFALQRADRLQGIIMVGPVFSPFGNRHRKFLHKAFLNSLRSGGVPALFDHYYPLLYGAKTVENNGIAGYLAIKRRFVTNNPVKQLEKHLTTTVDLDDNWKELSEIICPVHMIAGECDFLTDESSLRLMEERIPQATYHIIPLGGHNPYLDSTAAFETQVLRFAERVCV